MLLPPEHVLVLSLSPEPHVLVQALQLDQSDHAERNPSIKRYRVMVIIIWALLPKKSLI